jgi:MYXO-CTERM domain-containing protein
LIALVLVASGGFAIGYAYGGPEYVPGWMRPLFGLALLAALAFAWWRRRRET